MRVDEYFSNPKSMTQQ